jgi:hypothetical protein
MKKIILFFILLFSTQNLSCIEKTFILPGGVIVNIDLSCSTKNFIKNVTYILSSKNTHGAAISAAIPIAVDYIINYYLNKHKPDSNKKKKKTKKEKKKNKKRQVLPPTNRLAIITCSIIGTYSSIIPFLRTKHMAKIAGSVVLSLTISHFIYKIIEENIPIIHGKKFGLKKHIINNVKQFFLNLSAFLIAYYSTPQLKKLAY